MNKEKAVNESKRPPHYPALLASKLNKPRTRSHTIERQRLMTKIDEEIKAKLIFVTAPAGYGKTTAVGEWVRLKGLPAGWLSLDTADNNPIRFFDYLGAALNHVSPGISEQVLPSIYSKEAPDLKAVITQIINYLYSFTDDFVLIVDDYHMIHDTSIHESMVFLILHAPENMYIIIISRTDPPLCLPQLKAKGKLREINAGDLRFTSDETAAFYNKLNITLSSQELQLLESRTEGWAAMINWAALLIEKKKDISGALHAFRGDSLELTTYLSEEVFTFWPEEIREFLLFTSIIRQMDADLCDCLTGRSDSRDLLEELSHHHTFISVVSQEEELYRCHFLFAQFLQKQFASTRGDLLPLLHKKAAQWYEKKGNDSDAFFHYLQGGCFEQALFMLENKAPEIIKSTKDISTLVNCYKLLPQQLIEENPMLCLTYGWVLSLGGQMKESLLWARKAEKANKERRHKDQEENNRKWVKHLDGEIALLKAYIALLQKNLLQIVKQGTKASRNLIRESIFLRDAVAFNQCEASLLTGPFGFYKKLDRKTRSLFANNYVPVLQKIGFPEEYILITRAELFYEHNEMDLAVSLLMQGISQAEKKSNLGALIPAYITLARVCRAKGNIDGALEVVNTAEKKVRNEKHFEWLPLLKAVKVRLFLDMGKMDPVNHWLNQNRLSIYDSLELKREYEYITFAMVLVAKKKFDKAHLLLTRMKLFAEELDRVPSIIELLSLRALAYHEMGETDMAVSSLNEALSLGEEEGCLRSFIDYGAALLVLLKKYKRWKAKQGGQGFKVVSSKYVQKITELIKKDSSLRRGSSFLNGNLVDNHKLPLEPLTIKEVQVLRLLSQELSNQEIADRLSIKLNTVKVHTRHIYHKLDVKNRIRAVEKARDLGII